MSERRIDRIFGNTSDEAVPFDTEPKRDRTTRLFRAAPATESAQSIPDIGRGSNERLANDAYVANGLSEIALRRSSSQESTETLSEPFAGSFQRVELPGESADLNVPIWRKGPAQAELTSYNVHSQPTDPDLFKQFFGETPHIPEIRQSETLKLVSAVLSLEKEGRAEGKPNEDSVLNDPENGVFGVFDGVGGGAAQGKNPAAASRAAAKSVGETLVNIPITSTDGLRAAMRYAIDMADQAVRENGEGAHTTATFTKVVKINGEVFAGIAHAGDTQLYSYNRISGNGRLVTKDQTLEKELADMGELSLPNAASVITNQLPRSRGSSPNLFYVIKLLPGDRLMLCTDGISGDLDKQKLTHEEYVQAFRQPSALACAGTFLAFSNKQESPTFKKKNDDKSIVVIDIDER